MGVFEPYTATTGNPRESEEHCGRGKTVRLRDPYFLLFILAWIPMIWVYVRRERKFRPTVRFSGLSLAKSLRSSPAVRARHLLLVLRLVGVGLLAVALARPQKGHTEQQTTTHGVDIMLALDVSTSMKALDFKPQNRLFVAKETLKEFIGKRTHDRIGLVVFAGRSYTKCPLTLDYDVLRQFIDDIRFGELEDGTAIGTAIATAANRLKESEAKSKVIILSTDGANNAGAISPEVAAKAASELGIRIYTIGVGKRGRVPYPFEYVHPFTGERTTKVQMVDNVEVDEQSLTDVAAATGGKYFRARSSEELAEIYRLIDTMEKTKIKTKSYTTYSEHFFPWLLAGFLLLLVELILANTRFRRIP
ncbi:MAG: VWA domain-containing protein [Chitinivibrionales bacterium]|nr:VWA domain-containing protein [Chitinivibrionales bacterium]MBD3355534.1 VWA domain-containing protein [Chitinivibrionales bacterium]